jgi:two-component system chemotaxis response regulator CheB
VLFQSLAQEFGSRSVSIIMTGMGDDGVIGTGSVKAVGGNTIAQSPETCVVDSMPRHAIERGFVSRVVSLSNLAGVLQSICTPERLGAAPEAVTSPAGAADTELDSRRRSS